MKIQGVLKVESRIVNITGKCMTYKAWNDNSRVDSQFPLERR
jgi:hypothetical protein